MAHTRLSARLRAFRNEQGLSQAAVAGRAGVSREYIARLEAGHHDPPLSTLARLARALRVPLARLVS
jgi:transcriptional regulator with XRE-family HTH domain